MSQDRIESDIIEAARRNANTERLRDIARDIPGAIDAGVILDKKTSPLRLSDKAFDEVASLIESGMDYRGAMGAFTQLLSCTQDDRQTRLLTERMLENGFNPLQDLGDHLSTLLTLNAPRRLLSGEMARLEYIGQGLRDETGGNFYHAMARLAPREWRVGLEAVWGAIQEVDMARPGSQVKIEWLKAADNQGNTPLHLLWSEQARDSVMGLGKNTPEFKQIEDQLNRSCAMSTDIARRLGADLTLANAQGQHLWDLIKERDLSGLDEIGRKAIEPILALELRAQMEDQTPNIPGRGKPGIRL